MPRVAVTLALVVFAFLPVPGRIQDEDAGLCIDPTIEFPVPCDEDEE